MDISPNFYCLPPPSFFCSSSASNAAVAFPWVPCILLCSTNKKSKNYFLVKLNKNLPEIIYNIFCFSEVNFIQGSSHFIFHFLRKKILNSFTTFVFIPRPFCQCWKCVDWHHLLDYLLLPEIM